MTAPRLRWAIFSWSVVSAVDNPDAYLLRALGEELAARGHEATFYEERGNPALRSLLRRSGGAALSDFRARHPEIEYRTVEARSGADLVEWLTRTLATIDIALVQPEAPADLINWIGRLTRSHLQTYLLDSGLGPPPTELTVESREPGNFSGILAGSDIAASRYGRFVEPQRIHHFGPLPEAHRLAELAESETEQLRATAAALTDLVIEVAQHDRTARQQSTSSDGTQPS